MDNGVFFMQSYIDELCEEVSPLRASIFHFFDEYQDLKKDYDVLLLKMVDKDETIMDLQDCKQGLETGAI